MSMTEHFMDDPLVAIHVLILITRMHIHVSLIPEMQADTNRNFVPFFFSQGRRIECCSLTLPFKSHARSTML